MFSLFLDVAIYNLTNYSSFFVLFPICYFSIKKEWYKILILGIIVDILTSTWLINLAIFMFIYFFNYFYFKIFNLKFITYLILILLNYIIFSFLLYLINNYNYLEFAYLFEYLFNNLIINIIYYLLNYKFVLKLNK